jgi:hypothetical protein
MDRQSKKIIAELKSKESPVVFHIPSEQKTLIGFQIPPKMVYNDQGEMVEVILSYADYKTFLRFLADYVDWELLPSYLQDEVDHLLAEEARMEQGDEAPTSLLEALTELGIEPEKDAEPK